MKKQTAVEWSQSEIDNKDMGEIPIWIYDLIQQAKQMEKEQIENAYRINPNNEIWSNSGIDYYNETYGGDK
jgi:hypothetical protein